MSQNDREIRRNWQQFKSKQKKKEEKIIHVKKEDISKIFSKMFN